MKRRARNQSVRTTVKTAVKKAREAVASPEKGLATFRSAAKTLNKAATKGVLHPKNASRRIARLAKKLHAVTAKAN